MSLWKNLGKGIEELAKGTDLGEVSKQFQDNLEKAKEEQAEQQKREEERKLQEEQEKKELISKIEIYTCVPNKQFSSLGIVTTTVYGGRVNTSSLNSMLGVDPLGQAAANSFISGSNVAQEELRLKAGKMGADAVIGAEFNWHPYTASTHNEGAGQAAFQLTAYGTAIKYI